MKIVIVGAVAGGASAAARARRLSEDSEIILLEKGAEPSFANCGLPYYVGGEIPSRDALLVAPRRRLVERYNLDVRTHSMVTAIDRDAHRVRVRRLDDQSEYDESYDKLILSTGASPLKPPLSGIDSDRLYTLRDLSDADRLHEVVTGSAQRAVIIGGGFIGVEIAENFVRRGIEVSLVELANQILPPWDVEMVRDLESHVRDQGVHLRLGDSVSGFETSEAEITAVLESGARLSADLAVLCIGVRPESELAADAGLELGQRGAIVTSVHMQTSDPDIYAVGDVVQVDEWVSKSKVTIPLAGPANRQGRIAADHIFGRESKYRGTQGTAVVGVFGKTAAMTGLSEKLCQRLEMDYEKIYVHPSDHASYYPGATQMTIKLLFSPSDGKILGAQACGTDGVDKRIDVIAIAMQAGMTVYDLEESELCYAPQYGSAKDPVNMAGFVAAGVLRGDQPVVHADAMQPDAETTWIDVRTTAEYEAGHVEGAVNIPLEAIRGRIDEIPKSGKIVPYCAVGQRGYMATRLLRQHGLDASNLSGGYTTWRQVHSGNES